MAGLGAAFFAHPLRAMIPLYLLRNGPSSPVVMAKEFDVPLGTMAYHVRVLADAGILELNGERRVRGAVEHVYRLNTAALHGRAGLLRAIGQQYHALADSLQSTSEMKGDSMNLSAIMLTIRPIDEQGAAEAGFVAAASGTDMGNKSVSERAEAGNPYDAAWNAVAGVMTKLGYDS